MIECSLDWPDIYPSTGPCIRPGGPALTERALEVCHLPVGSRVVDIGCGAGGTLDYLKQTGIYRLTGLDFSEPLLREAIQRLEPGTVIRSSADVLPFKNDSFNALLCECVFSVLDDRMAAFLEFERVLKKGGFLVMSDVFSLQEQEKEASTKKTPLRGLLSQQDLKDVLVRSGFSLLLWEEHRTLLQEFVARMILAGKFLPDSWKCNMKLGNKRTDRPAISYFLLVARKEKTEEGTDAFYP